MAKSLLMAGVVWCALAASGWADTIYGECRYKDGSKAGGATRISTSWNSKTTSPANGKYVLDFGGKVGKTITVYINGTTVGRVSVNGQTRLDLTVP